MLKIILLVNLLFLSFQASSCLKNGFKLENTTKILYQDRLYDEATGQEWFYRDDIKSSNFEGSTIYKVKDLEGKDQYVIELESFDRKDVKIYLRPLNDPLSILHTFIGRWITSRDDCGLIKIDYY